MLIADIRFIKRRFDAWPCATSKIFVVLIPSGMTRGYILAFMEKGAIIQDVSGADDESPMERNSEEMIITTLCQKINRRHR
jgi:hypothetical protein